MADPTSYNIDLGLGILPEYDAKKDNQLYNELARIRSAIRNLALLLDSVNTVVTGGGGGTLISKWVEANSIAAPNNAVHTTSWTPSDTSVTNVDAVILPRGAGALIAAIPDSTAGGGNKRGLYSVDWQVSRSTAGQVASGQLSGILSGGSNTASNNYSIAAGFSNTASGANSLALGIGSLASATDAVAISHGGVADGKGSLSTGAYGLANGIATIWVHGTYGSFSGTNYAQQSLLPLIAETSGAVTSTFTSNALAASTDNQLTLINFSALAVRGLIVARDIASGDTSSWEFSCSIRRGANAASTTMVAACVPVLIAADAGAATWTVAVAADTGNGSLKITGTGQAAKTIRWSSSLWATWIVQ